MVTYLQYVGAPTFLSLHDNSRQQDRPASEGRALHKQMKPESGPPPSCGGQAEVAPTRTFTFNSQL